MNVYALQAIFEKTVMNFYECQYMGSAPEWLNLGLKAQNQLRKTLATLADIRNSMVEAKINEPFKF